MSSPASTVLIAGAGPTGLMMADLLRRWGIPVRLIDRNEGPARESRALGIQARTLELMRNLGLADRFLGKGLRSAGAAMFLNGRRRFAADFSDMNRPDTPYPYLLFLSQAETERLLNEDLDALRAPPVERGTELLDFSQKAAGVRARLRHRDGSEETVEAAFIVGCDGSHSRVRKQLGLEFKGDAYPTEFVMADARVHWDLPADVLHVFLDDQAVAVFFPLQKNGLSRVLSVRRYDRDADQPATDETTAFPARLEDVEDGLRRASHKDVRLSDPAWVTKFHVHHRSVRQTRVGRAFLAGDAAHIHSPAGAQGMNTGLQDAANLAWKIAAVLNGADERLLDTYHSERWPVGQKLLNFTDRFFSSAITRNRAFLLLRRIALPVAAKFMMSFPAGRRRLFGFISQLGIRYHAGFAAGEKLSPRAPAKFIETLRPGRRAPNARLADGRELFDLLTGYGFHILAFEKSPASASGRERLREGWRLPPWLTAHLTVHWLTAEGAPEIADRYGLTGEGLYLIRPDGYVGYRSDEIAGAFDKGAPAVAYSSL